MLRRLFSPAWQVALLSGAFSCARAAFGRVANRKEYRADTVALARQAIFQNERDCGRFVQLLSESAQRFEAAVLCFVLIGNHFHLGKKEKGSVLTIATGCCFGLQIGDAAPTANSIRGSDLLLDEPRRSAGGGLPK